ncbi:glycoside hydrolase superfamily [Dichotomocladium elegans]|nr:glycoside hydrolase superfamily [Dichotomocladium elegans]
MKTDCLFLILVVTTTTHALRTIFLWPQPQRVESGSTVLDMDPAFDIVGPDKLKEAIERTMTRIQTEYWVPVHHHRHPRQPQPQLLSELRVVVDDRDADLVQGVDETYNLHVTSTGAVLQAATIWGALHGLETFSQLVQYDGDRDALFIAETPIEIEDAPAFTHRGLLLDTARNYFAVFHWHISDSQSFPLELESVPELAEFGAYRQKRGKRKGQQERMVYTKADVGRIVAYARARGIRVIPEIDMPAHTGSWAKSHKHLTTCSGRFYLDPSNEWSERYAAQPTTGQLNPVLEETYELVQKVVEEVASLFPDAMYHGGGDEPVFKCWLEDEHVQRYIHTHNVTARDLLEMFLTREVGFIQQAKKVPILWEDPVTVDGIDIPTDVVLQVWYNPVQQAAKKGYKVIASHAQFWYLDCGHGGWTGNDTTYDEQFPPPIPASLLKELERHNLTHNYRPQNWGGMGGDWCGPFKTWQRIYSYDMTFNLTREEAKNVLGGEIAMWTEQTDPVGLDGRLWPRTAAAAEVLWSGRYNREDGMQRDLGDAMVRLFDWRFRLVSRGIQAEALQPFWWYVRDECKTWLF